MLQMAIRRVIHAAFKRLSHKGFCELDNARHHVIPLLLYMVVFVFHSCTTHACVTKCHTIHMSTASQAQQ